MTVLPPEIWAAIFNSLHCNYYNICRVSSAFHRIATCGLYGHVELKGHGTVFRFLRTIKNKPHLGIYIAYGMIRNVLEHAQNLRHFHLDLELEFQSRSKLIFPLQPPFTLESFVSDIWCDSGAASFIEKQPSLLKLVLTGKFSSVFKKKIGKNHVPNLTHLECNPMLMAAFIPGRPVSILELALTNYKADILGALQGSTAPGGLMELVIFCANQIEPFELMNQAAQHAPNLVLLGISFGIFAAPEGLTEERLTDLTPAIAQLKSLKCLVLSSKNPSFDDIADERSIIERWAKETTTLAVINMPSKRRWYKALRCTLCHINPVCVDCSHPPPIAWKESWVSY